jgi:hypothetical protein
MKKIGGEFLIQYQKANMIIKVTILKNITQIIQHVLRVIFRIKNHTTRIDTMRTSMTPDLGIFAPLKMPCARFLGSNKSISSRLRIELY